MMDCAKIFHEADFEAQKAVTEASVRPMIVNDGNRSYFISDGVCGFASVKIKPVNCAMAKWMKANIPYCGKAYNGGMEYPIMRYNQSMQKKEKYAMVFSGVLNKYGINSTYNSMMD
jgi:hypothetical protein